MDLELMRTFLELNRTRHFGRVADALHITQAAVSSRLKSLERQLGVTLFERSRRDMRLTPEGARLVRHAERLIAAWRAARQEVSLAAAGEQLVIGGSLRLWDVLLQRWVHDLRRHFPDLAIIADSQTPDYLLDADTAFFQLFVLGRSRSDVLLVIRRPDGSVLCNDNRQGTKDPMIRSAFPIGTTQVWIGVKEEGGTAAYRLGFSEVKWKSSSIPLPEDG